MTLRNLVTSQNHYISTITGPMTMKLGRMLPYLEGHLTIKSHNALITWFCKVTWQTKIIISLLSEFLWPHQSWYNGGLLCQTNKHKVILRFDCMVMQGHVTNKNCYIFPTREPYGYKPGRMTTQLDEFLHVKSLSPFDYVVLRDHVTKLKPLYLFYHNIYGHQTS